MNKKAIIVMGTFDIVPHKCKTNSETLAMHVSRTPSCVLRHMLGTFR